MVTGTHGPTANDHQSIGELIGRLSEQGARLVHAEIELAKAEMAARAQAAGIGIGMLAGAAMFGFFEFVSIGLRVRAATLALVGRNMLQAGTTKPDRTVENVKKDVDAVKEGLS